jgi:hypothetical protein
VSEDNSYGDRGRLRGHLPDQLPAYAPCNPAPESRWALNRNRLLLDFVNVYDRTTLSRRES